MKTNRILQTVIVIVIIVFATSCRTSRSGSDQRYPRTGYPYPDSRRYPDYPQYPNENYPVYNDPNPRNLPPGQAKKIYGGQSARPYAPGQRKKYGNDYHRYPLIVIRTPGIVIGRYNDGRYYYRNQDGFLYWKGSDDRYYLDEKYLDRTNYNDDEYRDWKYRGKNHDKEDWNDNKHGKGNNKGKNH